MPYSSQNIWTLFFLISLALITYYQIHIPKENLISLKATNGELQFLKSNVIGRKMDIYYISWYSEIIYYTAKLYHRLVSMETVFFYIGLTLAPGKKKCLSFQICFLLSAYLGYFLKHSSSIKLFFSVLWFRQKKQNHICLVKKS